MGDPLPEHDVVTVTVGVDVDQPNGAVFLLFVEQKSLSVLGDVYDLYVRRQWSTWTVACKK